MAPFSMRIRPQRAQLPAILLCLLAFVLQQSALAQFSAPASVNLGIGTPPSTITGTVSEDLDGDGLADLVGTDNANTGRIGLALGLAGGGYATQAPIQDPAGSPGGAFLPRLADFDLDGNLDLCHAGTTPAGGATHSAVFVLLGTPGAGTYTFTPAVTIPIALLASTITALSTTDYDGDGDQDILYTVTSPVPARRAVGIIPNVGGGAFGPLHSSTTATGPTEIDICVDYNRDGRKDLVICRPLDGLASFIDIYAGQPTPPLIPSSPTISLQLPVPLDASDVHWLDCDQKDGYDLAVTITGSFNGVLMIRNSGVAPFFSTGAIGPLLSLPGRNISLLRLEADFDGLEDLTVYSLLTSGSERVAAVHTVRVQDCLAALVATTSSGTYDDSQLDEETASPHAVADQRGDGLVDLIAVNNGSTTMQDQVLVFQNQAPVSYAINPARPLLAETTPVDFLIQVPAALAGRRAFLLFSFNGTLPGMTIVGSHVPLNLPLQPQMLVTTIAPGGNGSFTIGPVTFPPNPVLFSAQLASACLVEGASPGTLGFVTNPAVITIP